jgi:hypothetical protein
MAMEGWAISQWNRFLVSEPPQEHSQEWLCHNGPGNNSSGRWLGRSMFIFCGSRELG